MSQTPLPDNLPMSSFSFTRLSVQERAFLLKLTQNPRRAFPPRTETVQTFRHRRLLPASRQLDSSFAIGTILNVCFDRRGGLGVGNNEFPRNSLDLAAERGNSDFDVGQRLVLNYSWSLPIDRGHDHLADGFAGKIFEGWEVAGITTFSGGLPYDIFTALDTAHTGQQQRPDYNAAGTPLSVTNPRTQTGPNLGLFSDPALRSAGNLGRNHPWRARLSQGQSRRDRKQSAECHF